MLMKNGFLHPVLLFASWPSIATLWRSIRPWVEGLRKERNNPHVYENVDWLVDFENRWRMR
jgi:hypothetical protein